MGRSKQTIRKWVKIQFSFQIPICCLISWACKLRLIDLCSRGIDARYKMIQLIMIANYYTSWRIAVSFESKLCVGHLKWPFD